MIIFIWSSCQPTSKPPANKTLFFFRIGLFIVRFLFQDYYSLLSWIWSVFCRRQRRYFKSTVLIWPVKESIAARLGSNHTSLPLLLKTRQNSSAEQTELGEKDCISESPCGRPQGTLSSLEFFSTITDEKSLPFFDGRDTFRKVCLWEEVTGIPSAHLPACGVSPACKSCLSQRVVARINWMLCKHSVNS